MSLWGNKDLVYDDGTVAVNFTTKKVVGTGATFNTAGLISPGMVLQVGAGSTFGYAVITAVDSASTLSIDNTNGFVLGISTVLGGASYAISAEPAFGIDQYCAPEVKGATATTSPNAPNGYSSDHTSSVYGVDTDETQAIGTGTTATFAQRQFQPAHAGWVGVTTYIDCHGTTRVKTETLVAMGKDSGGLGGIQNDADSSIIADDTEYPDSI